MLIIRRPGNRANANATLQCPIKPDEYEIEQTVELPAEIPRGKFNFVVVGEGGRSCD